VISLAGTGTGATHQGKIKRRMISDEQEEALAW
jgi:hypothetical protein